MSEKQVVQAMDHCVQAMEAYITQTHRLQWKPSDDAFIMCMEYVDEMRKKRMEFVEKIQKRKEDENKMEEEEDKPKEREKFYREKCHKIKCKCETKCTYTIHDHIHDVAKIYRKEYPRMTLNRVLGRTHVNIWKGQGGRSYRVSNGY